MPSDESQMELSKTKTKLLNYICLPIYILLVPQTQFDLLLVGKNGYCQRALMKPKSNIVTIVNCGKHSFWMDNWEGGGSRQEFKSNSFQDLYMTDFSIVIWKAPSPYFVKLNTDGVSRGYPGYASGVGVIRDSYGKVISAFSSFYMKNSIPLRSEGFITRHSNVQGPGSTQAHH
ncbi:hypothetical protein ACH5RR_029773 [Cinchona calisaya]|uniref:Uncharacterized protein n=1 Tax=Cinchona calisaya TaxID=153742 RepID=A0ABD2YSP4_9GENT